MLTEDVTALVWKMQAGDEAAFDEIYAVYSKAAVRTAVLISGDTHLAQDIAQEAFVLCMLRIEKLKNAECFRAWFFRILTRCAWRMIRRRDREAPLDTAETRQVPSEPDNYPGLSRAEYAYLYRALDELSSKQRTAVVLYYFNDLSVREIAQVCGVPEATVKTRLFAARSRLRRTLDQKGGTENEAKH